VAARASKMYLKERRKELHPNATTPTAQTNPKE
jgi:hypothetical protein